MSIITFQRGDKTALTKNFTKSEFECPCGCGQQSVDTELAEKFQLIRDKVDRPLKITSGYRCITHNASKGRCRMDIGEFICDKVWELAPLNRAPDDTVAEAEEEEAL